MKNTRRFFLFVTVLFTAVSGWSQAIQFISVTRQANYVQTGPSTVSADPTTPFLFRVAVEGDNATTGSSPLTAATFTPPGGSATPLTYDTNGHRWIWDDASQTNMINLNAAYGTGSYGFNLTGTPNGTPSVTVGSFASTQLQIPQLTLSGGSWVGNTYELNAGATLTVSFNAVYSGSVSSTLGFHYDVELNGNGNVNANDFINWDPTINAAAAYAQTPPNFVANSLTAGSYTLQVNYDEIQNPATGAYASAFSASLLEYRTSVSVTVIPEPATYVAIFGSVACLGVAFKRRRALAGVMLHCRRRAA